MRYGFTKGAGGVYTPNWLNQPYTKVTLAECSSGSTMQNWAFLRPKNWTYIKTAVAAAATTVAMFDDPGLYSTNYKYALPTACAGVPGNVADNSVGGVTSTDVVCFQLDNGYWHFSTVTSMSAALVLTLDTAVPTPAGSTAAVGSILFFFGTIADVDPATGAVDPLIRMPVSATTILNIEEGIATSLRPGEPLALYNANATADSTLNNLYGAYDSY